MSEKQNIVVIGGGVIGMSIALELASRGAQVTVIDRGEPGFGCSYGNAGWITPCFAMPLPMPGMLLKSIGWLLNPDSPLYIKPEPSILLFRWLTRFLFSMNQKHLDRSVDVLTGLSKYSLESYEKLSQDSGSTIGFEKKGLLMVGQSEAGVKAAVHEMELVARHGIPGQYLDERGVKELEPALTGRIQGGVYFPAEAHGEPLAIVQALASAAQKHGVKILPRTEVYDFVIEGRKIRSLKTTRGELKAHDYVLATGSWSHTLGKALKLRIPVLGGKGYALITKPFAPAPRLPLMLIEKKIAVTPRNGSIRLAGTLELVNRDESITPRRVENILRGSREFLSVPERPEITEVWRGLRPCTPDGVPVIGRPKAYDNLMLSTGHQMLGLQSAPGSARLTADLLLGAQPIFDPKPFRADRF